jgi:hypothetical protein
MILNFEFQIILKINNNDKVIISNNKFQIILCLISTNNIARGMVRGSQVRFQSIKNTLSSHPTRNVFFLAIDPVISQPNLSLDSLDPSPQRLGDDGIQLCRTRPSSPLTLAGIDASSRRTYQRLIPLCRSSARWLKSMGDTEGQVGGRLSQP